MNNQTSTYKTITTAATTTFAGENKKVVLVAININQALTGTLVIKTGSTTIATIAATTPAGEYWYNSNGTEISDLTITNASTENVTVFYRNI